MALRAPGSTGEASPPPGEAVRSHRSSPAEPGDIRRFIRAHGDTVAAVGAWILLNVLYVSFWPTPYTRERRYLQTLRAINVEVQNLHAKPTSDAQWHQFSERARQTLAPIVSDLKKSASSSEPARQRLLWSARDVIPRTIGPRNKEREEQEQQLKQYLDTAQRELESN